ncbi:MAG: hypothetical protein IIZ09_00245 [Ruminococcus sp.]|nr:hypothetical protein [Ruminococcus sp.]
MKGRKTFAVIFYVLCAAALIAAGVISFMAFRGTMDYTFGFLLFMPIWIGSYWFLSFFNALARLKKGKKIKWVIAKPVTRGLSTVANILSVLLVCFWIYAYIFKIMPVSK